MSPIVARQRWRDSDTNCQVREPPICAPPALCWLAFRRAPDRSLCRLAAQRGPRHLAWPRVVGEGRLRCEPGPAVTGPDIVRVATARAVLYGPQVGRSQGRPCRPLETRPAMRAGGRPTRARGERALSDRDQRTARRGNDACAAGQGSISCAARRAAAMASGLQVRAKTSTAVSANLITCASPCPTARVKVSLAVSSRECPPPGGSGSSARPAGSAGA
jgi:hypothetical protein